jgi:DNA-binding NarL/FixJ family response regulator
MELLDKKIQLIVASDHFLCRLGIKTLLSVIGVDADLLEIKNLGELNSELNNGNRPSYLIISDSILPSPRHKFIEDLRVKCADTKLMIICEKLSKTYNCDQLVVQSYEQKQVLEKFQDFFNEPEPVVNSEETSVLSDREIDVLKSVALGLSNKEVADHLCISINTVITHRKNITSKLGIKSISGLTVYALLNNIIQAEEVH